jgi:hypothetical protein
MSEHDRPRRPDRFAVLRFSLHVDDYPTEEEARGRGRHNPGGKLE